MVSGVIESKPAKAAAEPGPAPVIRDGAVDDTEFDVDALWRRHQVDEGEQRTVHKAQTMLADLPAEAEDSLKRTVAKASLAAFDISVDDIVAAASHQLEALEDYIADTRDQTDSFVASGEERIRDLEAEIEGIRDSMRQAEARRDQLTQAAQEVVGEVAPILEFFQDSSQPRFKVASAPGSDD